MKFWILLLCAVIAGVKAQSDEAAFPDDWYEDYNDRWYEEELKKLGIVSGESDASEDTINEDINTAEVQAGNQEKSQDEIDKKVEEEIQQFQENKLNYDDYLYEDNRLKDSENFDEEKKSDNVELIREVDDDVADDNVSKVDNDYDDYGFGDKIEGDEEEEDALKNDEDIQVSKDDDIVPLPMPFESSHEMKEILEETKAILGEEEQKMNDFERDELKEIIDETKTILNEEEQKPNDFSSDELKEIIEETKAILDEEAQKSNDFANDSDSEKEIKEDNEDTAENIDDTIEKQIDENLSDNILNEDNEDTVDKVYEDLNEDLDTLFETLNKLANSLDENPDSVAEEQAKTDEQTNDELEKSDDDTLFETLNKLPNSMEDSKIEPVNVDYAVDSDESLNEDGDYENIFDSNLSDLFAEHSKAEDEKLDSAAEELAKDDEQTDNKLEETIVDAVEVMKPQVMYGDDALVSDDNNDDGSIKTVKLEDLSSGQLDKMMDEFAVQHSDVFNVQPTSDNEVNEITLKYGDTEVIESDNFPSPYPTGKVVDWIITGEGQGIEINVTDFSVTSAQEHYLLVKPGQVDASGPDGLLFAYHLNEPRAYRFTDVDRLFIRFNSVGGFAFSQGFRMTVKMIAPPPSEPEPLPEAEPVLPEPRIVMSLLLGGLTLQEFNETREDFRLLIADMATLYINANGIDPGMNTTAEITQITSASMCNVQWPGYETCTHIKFSVPLMYEDEDEEDRLNEDDLQTMWRTYVDVDPFASRLKQMGIEEFTAPNDGGVLTVWLVVALGVVVSAAMLAFALWRYSCFEDYSRMPAFSDTDSVNEKRGLDLFPTPHQTLPPLYSESEYKWDNDSTRVDMGGYANRSYVRTDMYDLDSEEDIPVARDRYTTDV